MLAEKEEIIDVSLKTNVVPLNYKLHLNVDMIKLNYTGTINVKLHVNESSEILNFHNFGPVLDFSNIKLVSESNPQKAFKIIENSFNKTLQDVTLTFDSKFSPNDTLDLTIPFTKDLSDNMNGFYKSKYTQNDEERWIATTHFEPAFARTAFPCWDEPVLKATWEISITSLADRTILSNMPVEKEVIDKLKTVQFQVTPKISTYLLAFIIGEFEYLEAFTQHKIPIRIYTTVGKSSMGKFALDVATKSLDFFTKYFDLPYPLPKLDMVSIPDFAAGAMENWGLITYRESALLCDLEKSSVTTRFSIAQFVGHEEAHQWFGNIVSPKSWKDLWLNEGFATWAENLVVGEIFPEWDVWIQFYLNCTSHALSIDSLENSHPIEVDVSYSHEIDEIFDDISYSKSAAVICMLEDILGKNIFARGLHNYLVKHSYSNASTNDMWESLSEYSELDVKDMMHNWTSKVGYPVVEVKTHPDDPNLLLFSQERFLSNGLGLDKTNDSSTIWNIQISIKADLHPEPIRVVLDKKNKEFGLGLPPKSEYSWLKVNYKQKGLYRVHYSPYLLKKISAALSSRAIGPEDRLGILGDAFALSRAGILDLSAVLELYNSCKEEENPFVWLEICGGFDSIMIMWEAESIVPQLREMQLQLFSSIGTKLGWLSENDSDNVRRLRGNVLQVLAKCGNDAVIAEARKKFEDFIKDPDSLPGDLISPVFRITARNGDKELFEKFKKIYLEAKIPMIKIEALIAIGLFPDLELTKSAFMWALDSGDVRTQDLYLVTFAGSKRSASQQIIWTLLKQNWEKIYSKLADKSLLATIIRHAAAGFSTHSKAQEVKEFFDGKDLTGIKRTVDQCIEIINSSANWFEQEKSKLNKWISKA